MLTYLTTSIFHSPAQTLINPVNTVGVMGKGLALAFKQRYPAMFQEYRTRCQAGELEVGQLHIYRAADKIIVNFPPKNIGAIRPSWSMSRQVCRRLSRVMKLRG